MSFKHECLSDFAVGCFVETNIAWTKERCYEACFSKLYIECE